MNFDGKVFEKIIVKAKGIKYLAKTFTLPDVQVGGIIEYYYTDDFKELTLCSSRTGSSAKSCSPRKAQFSLKPYAGNFRESVSAALDLATSASGCRIRQRGSRPHCPHGSQQYPGVPDRRLHAAGK